MNIPAALSQCTLFTGIDESRLPSLLDCLKAVTRKYGKDDFIFSAGGKASAIGIVLSGAVRILQEDFWGNRAILAHMGPGEIFGEAFACAGHGTLSVSVAASETSEIMTLAYPGIVTPCQSACEFHTMLVMNMMRTLAGKNIQLTRKLEHLSRRTIRQKLLSFLSAQAALARKSTVEIPFNKKELAEYLCVDRSALSRELGAMRDEGLIRYDRKNFELLQPEYPLACK